MLPNVSGLEHWYWIIKEKGWKEVRRSESRGDVVRSSVGYGR